MHFHNIPANLKELEAGVHQIQETGVYASQPIVLIGGRCQTCGQPLAFLAGTAIDEGNGALVGYGDDRVCIISRDRPYPG